MFGHEFQQEGPRRLDPGDLRPPPAGTGARTIRRLGPNADMPDWYQQVITALLGKVDVYPVTFTQSQNAAQLWLPSQDRTYLIIQNKDAANKLYVGIGYVPTAGSGFVITAGGFYEPFRVPQQEIWLLADVAPVSGLILVATQPGTSTPSGV